MIHISQFSITLIISLLSLTTPSSPLKCFETVFPQVMGGTNANTDIYSIDFDSSSNLVFSGGTFDTSIQSEGGPDATPVVAYISSGGTYLWSKQFAPDTLSNAIIVQFNTLATKVVAVFESAALYFVTLDATSGSILNSYWNTGGTFAGVTGSMVIDSSDNIYLGMANVHTWFVAQFTMTTPTLSFSWGKSAGIATGQAYSLVFGESESVLYVAGQIFYLTDYYQSLTRISTSGTVDWNYGQGTLSTSYYEMTQIVFATFSSVNYVYGCSQGVSSQSNNIGLTQFTMSGTNTVSTYAAYLDSSSAVSAYCEGIYVSSVDSVYNIIYYSSGNIHYTFTDLSLASPKTYHTLLSSVSGTNTVVNFAYFISATSVYFGGSLMAISGAVPSQSYSYSIGFIMTYDQAQSCLTISYSPTNLVLTSSAFSFASFSPTVASVTLGIVSPGVTNSNTVSTGSVTTTSWCSSQAVTLSPPTISDTTYVISSGSSTITFASFTVSPTCSDTVFTYTATLSSLAALPSIISFSSTNQQFTLLSTSNSDANTYTIILTGTVPTKQSVSTTFTITFVSSCSVATVTETSQSPISYVISTAAQTTIFNAFTISDSSCSITYTMTLTGGTAYDTTIITSFTSSSRAIVVSTSDYSKVGTYSLTITGTVTGYTNYNTAAFTLTLTIDCSQDVISSSAISSWSYDINTGSASTLILAWTQLFPSCGSITYTLAMVDGSTLDTTVVSMSGATITVSTSSPAKEGSYNLIVTAAVSTYATASQSFTLTVYQGCATTVIYSTTIPDQSYDINSGGSTTLATLDWTQSQTSCAAITYALTTQSGSAVDTSVVNLVGSAIVVQTSSASKIGIYLLEVTASVSTYATASQSFTLTVYQGCATTVIYSTTIPDQSYDINSGDTTTLATLDWTQSQTSCAAITYAFTTQSDSAVDTSVVNLVGSAIEVYTTSAAKVGIYLLEVTATVSTYATASQSFTLTVYQGCATTVIYSTTIPDQSYDIDSGDSTTLATLDWTQSQTSCPAITYAFTTQSGSAVDTSVVNLVGSAIIVQTTSAAKIGIYLLEVTASVSTYATSVIQFQLNVVEACASTVITPVSISTLTYDINSGSASTIPTLSWSQSISPCPSIVYALYNQGGTTADSSVVTLSSDVVSVSTTNPLKVNTYNLEIVGTVTSLGGVILATQTEDFQVIVIQSCSSTVITPVSISGQTYDINTGSATTITTLDWSETQSSCTITYSVVSSPVDSSLVFITSGDLLQVYATSVSSVGTYSVTVTGEDSSYPSKAVTTSFTLSVFQSCSSSTITAPTIPDYTYTLSDSAGEIADLTLWTQSQTGCPAISFVLQTQTGGTVSASMAYISSDILYVYATSATYLNTYQLEVIGTITGYPASATTVTFQLTITQSCSGGTVSPTSIGTQIYTVGGSALPIVFTDWSYSITPCGYFVYTAQANGATLPTFISFTSTTRTFSVVSSSTSDCNTYTIVITGTITSGASSTYSFTLDVLNPCPSATLSNSGVSDQTYYIGDSSITLDLAVFTSSVSASICGAFTYTLLYSNGSSIDTSIFTFASTTPSLTIETTWTSSVNTYSFELSAYQGTYSSNIDTTLFQVSILNHCDSLTITPPSPLLYVYDVSDWPETIQISNFSTSLSTCGTVQYKCTNTDNTTLDASLFTFNQNNLKLQIFTTDYSKVGKYYLQVKGTVSDYASAYLLINITISFSCEQTSIQTIPIQNQYYQIGANLKAIQFSSWVVSNSLCGINLVYQAFLQNSSTLPQFITFNGTQRTFQIYSNSTSDAGSYQIQVKGIDTSFQISDSVDFTLTVPQYNITTNLNSTPIIVNHTSSSVSKNKTSVDILSINQVTKTQSQYMSAWIQNISNLGLARIQFSEDILIYPDFSDLDGEIFILSISNDKTDLIKTWSIVSFTTQYVEVQLNFTDPTSIGTSIPSDLLGITFAEDNIFYSVNMMKELPHNYFIQEVIPAQFSNQCNYFANNSYIEQKAQVQSVAFTMATSFQILTSCSFVIQVILNGSLQLMWGLINTLQLLVYVPLFSITLPANLQIVITQIVYLLNFNYFNLGLIETEALQLETNYTQYSDRANFVGYSSSNYVLNMGFGLCTVFLYPVIIVFYFIIRKVQQKYVVKVRDFLRRFLYYNGTLRYFIESTIEITTSALIQFLVYQKYNEPGDIVSLMLAIVMQLINICMMIVPFLLIRNKDILKKKEFKQRFSELYEGIDTRYNSKLFFFDLYFIRRFSFLGLAFGAQTQPSIQVLGFLILNLWTISYLVYVQPFKERKIFYTEIFNEVCHMLASYTILGFTDLLDNASWQYNGGWFYFGILALNFVVNSGLIIKDVARNVIRHIKYFKNWYCQRKFKKKPSSKVLPIERFYAQSNFAIKLNKLDTIFEQDEDEQGSPTKKPSPTHSQHTDENNGPECNLNLKYFESVEVQNKRNEMYNDQLRMKFSRQPFSQDSFQPHAQGPINLYNSQKLLDYSNITNQKDNKRSISQKALRFQEQGLRSRTESIEQVIDLGIKKDNYLISYEDISVREEGKEVDSVSDVDDSIDYNGPLSDEQRLSPSSMTSSISGNDSTIVKTTKFKQTNNILELPKSKLYLRNQNKIKISSVTTPTTDNLFSWQMIDVKTKK